MAGVDHPFAIVPCLMLADVRPTSVVVYAVLAEHANADQECWPSINRIASRSNLSATTVRSAIQQLEETGWVTVRGRATDDGRQTSNLYKIRRVRNSDLALQISGGAPLGNLEGPSSESWRRTRPKEPDPSNTGRSPKYKTAADTREMLDEYKNTTPPDDVAVRLRAARDSLRD